MVTYFGGVQPYQIERVEIERRVWTVKNRPCSELSGGEAGDDNAGELRVVEVRRCSASGDGGEGG